MHLSGVSRPGGNISHVTIREAFIKKVQKVEKLKSLTSNQKKGVLNDSAEWLEIDFKQVL